MPRTKTSKTSKKRKKKVLKETKGFKWDRSKKYRKAKEALSHARRHAYRDRRTKKRYFRRLWQTQINAAARQHGLSYSKFIHRLKQNNIELNRKMLATLAKDQPKIFEKIVEKVRS